MPNPGGRHFYVRTDSVSRQDPLQQMVEPGGIFCGPGVMALWGVDAGIGQGGELLHPFGEGQVVVTGGDDGHRLPKAAESGTHRPAGQRCQVGPSGGAHQPAAGRVADDTAQERLFTPTCDTREINRCSNDKLRNTYDNTIVYIDQLLDQIIHRLEQRPDWKSSLLFVSDHGESLGENGMYLHGTPYAIAPEYQTRVPMTMWLSPAWLKQKSTDLACLNSQSKQAYSHDNIFHTLVGLSDADPRTISQYRADEDILAKCRGNH